MTSKPSHTSFAIVAIIAIVALVGFIGIIGTSQGNFFTQNLYGGAVGVPAVSLFTNGDFEAGNGADATSWEEEYECNDRYGCWYRELINGNWWWKASVPANNGWAVPLNQKVILQAATKYTLEFNYECVTATAPNTNSWHMRFRDESKPCCYDAFTNKGTATLADGSTITKPMSRFSCAAGEKGKFSGTFTTPENFNPADIWFWWWAIANAGAPQEILIDDLEVCEGTCESVVVEPTGSLSANPNPCVINPDVNQCASLISWESNDVREPKVQVRIETYTGEEKIFRCWNANTPGSGMTGKWIPPQGRIFRLYTANDCTLGSTGKLLDEMIVETVQPIRGVFFNPEVYKDDGSGFGNAWLRWYHLPVVQEQVKEELRQLKAKTDMNLVVISGSSFLRFAWPEPTSRELDNTANFIKDANAEGFKTSIGIGHPFIVPEEARISGIQKELVCGHKKGETVNGFLLFWDVPPCPETEAELLSASKNWFTAVIQGLESRGATEGLAYYSIYGHYGMPFAAEMNMFGDSDPYLDEAQRFVNKMFPYLVSITDVPIAAQLQPSGHFTWQDDSAIDYSFIDNFFDVVNIDIVDHIDITSSPKVDPKEILQRIGEENAYKVILSDFKPGFFMENGWTQAEVIAQQTSLAKEYNLGGWWYWVYRDFQNGPPSHIGLRERRATKTTVDGIWKEEAVLALK